MFFFFYGGVSENVGSASQISELLQLLTSNLDWFLSIKKKKVVILEKRFLHLFIFPQHSIC